MDQRRFRSLCGAGIFLLALGANGRMFIAAFSEARENCKDHLSEEAAGQLLYEKLLEGKSKILDLELREFRRLPASKQVPDFLLDPAFEHFKRLRQVASLYIAGDRSQVMWTR